MVSNLVIVKTLSSIENQTSTWLLSYVCYFFFRTDEAEHGYFGKHLRKYIEEAEEKKFIGPICYRQ